MGLKFTWWFWIYPSRSTNLPFTTRDTSNQMNRKMSTRSSTHRRVSRTINHQKRSCWNSRQKTPKSDLMSTLIEPVSVNSGLVSNLQDMISKKWKQRIRVKSRTHNCSSYSRSTSEATFYQHRVKLICYQISCLSLLNWLVRCQFKPLGHTQSQWHSNDIYLNTIAYIT